MKLASVEELVLDAVRFQPAPPALVEIVRGAGGLDGAAAVDVYRRMYWYRFVEALGALLPRTMRLLGGAEFTRQVCAFIAARPSKAFALERLAAPCASFLAEREMHPLIKDVARLEASLIDSLISPDPPLPLFTRADTQRPSFERFLLGRVPSVHMCAVRRSAVQAYEAVDVSGDPSADPMRLDPFSCGPDEDVSVLFVRPRFSVEHFVIDAEDARALDHEHVAAGDLLVSLARGDDVIRAFRLFSKCIDHCLFMLEDA